jgi:hypothetical protein
VDEIKLILLYIGGLATLVVIVSAGLARLRDELWLQGWLSKGRLAEMAKRAHTQHVRSVLEAIGFNPNYFDAVRHGLESAQIRERLANSTRKGEPLSARLLRALKPVTRQLEPGFRYQESDGYYIDTMGAMYNLDVIEEPLAILLREWIDCLSNQHVIQPFDCILANKDGNVALAHKLWNYLAAPGEKALFVCKGANDRSRVQRDSYEEAHVTDFEGLYVFMRKVEGRSLPRNKMRVLAIDDNCTGGATICSVIERFNSWLLAANGPFEPVTEAVVLFVVKDSTAQKTFESHKVTVHSLLSLGKDEMQSLIENDLEALLKDCSSFKEGFACQASRDLKL